MKIERTDIPGVLVVTPARHFDARGHFEETWNAADLRRGGITTEFVQDNQSFSSETGTLRGLHFQRPPVAQAKLVRCVTGRIWDVAVDLRPGSPTFCRWFGLELSGENGCQLLVPEGCAHGFVTRTDACLVAYRCSQPYAPDVDCAIAHDDPDLNIPWPVAPHARILSDRDRAAPRMHEVAAPFEGWAA